ncbi:MAG: hypothetical protein AVDCRST_MAG85-3715 [uncultured Solirubrobacteraceae bacterium]|uniref:Uncharacterized protein n=1 Tax=uncultured Solirubrobacteraceae bacterium TaxID=1162706 RepID=A0A6J4TTX7_9ACTN|nr:MAG: hypothetical protein AVDCRST_MAG85-3715 [uncultured Solirubrobacteraceae bacterium]
MDLVVAALGINALWFLFIWMASAIIASYLSGRKGYGDRVGLASGLLLAPLGIIIWLIVPPKPESDWKAIGPFGRQKVTAGDVAPAAHQQSGGAGVSK